MISYSSSHWKSDHEKDHANTKSEKCVLRFRIDLALETFTKRIENALTET